jgi:hypothetical protein
MLSLICLGILVAVACLSVCGFWPQLALTVAGGLFGASEQRQQRRRMRRLAAQYEAAQNRALRANLDRYGQGLREYGSMYRRGMGGFSDWQRQGREDIEERGRQREAMAGQETVGRGLAGTTILPTLRAGAERERASELRRLGSDVASRRAMYEQALTQPRLAFMERRTDEYPDFGEMAGIAGMEGQGYSTGRYLMEQLPMLAQSWGDYRNRRNRPRRYADLYGGRNY